MPKSGEVRINGAHVFINDTEMASLRPMPPVAHRRRDMNAAPKPPPRSPAKARPNPGAAKRGKPSAPAGGGTPEKRAEQAKYWAAHPAEYRQWARAHGKNYTDCGVFIGKVMRDSGSDPNYPTGWTGAQWDYVNDPKNGWTTGQVSDGGMEPGDVLLHKPYLRPSGNFVGHTGLYVGPDPDQPGHYVTDEASLGGHGPEARSKYTEGGLARTYEIWARPPGGG